MEPIVWMSLGAGGVVSLIVMRLAAKHGWAWVQAQLKQHAAAAEAEFKAKVTAAAGDLAPRVAELEGRLKAAVENELAPIKADVAALKSRVGV
jgi:hypothetical protein